MLRSSGESLRRRCTELIRNNKRPGRAALLAGVAVVKKLLFELATSLRGAAANDDDYLMRSAHIFFKSGG